MYLAWSPQVWTMSERKSECKYKIFGRHWISWIPYDCMLNYLLYTIQFVVLYHIHYFDQYHISQLDVFKRLKYFSLILGKKIQLNYNLHGYYFSKMITFYICTLFIFVTSQSLSIIACFHINPLHPKPFFYGLMFVKASLQLLCFERICDEWFIEKNSNCSKI